MGAREAYDEIVDNYDIYIHLHDCLSLYDEPETFLSAVVSAYETIKRECPEMTEE